MNAGVRGMNIGTGLLEEVQKLGVEVMLNTVAYGFYPNDEGVALAVNGEEVLVGAFGAQYFLLTNQIPML